MEEGIVGPLLLFRSIEGDVFRPGLVQDAPVGAPCLDASAFIGSRSQLPPAALFDGHRLFAGIDIAELAALFAGAQDAGEEGQHGRQAEDCSLAGDAQGFPGFGNAFDIGVQGRSFGSR